MAGEAGVFANTKGATMKRFPIGVAMVFAAGSGMTQPAMAQQALVIKPLAEKKVTELPAGPLVWRLENFPAVEQAAAAAGPTALVVQAGGKVWLFTLGPAGGASRGATRVAEVGPIPRVVATHYLLRINEASGPPGSITPVHTHPGSEAFYVLAGETSSRSPHGVTRVAAGQAEAGHGADMPMQVSSSGAADLRSLVMFVVDADKPFSSPAQFP
jgi:hypothetical protein